MYQSGVILVWINTEAEAAESEHISAITQCDATPLQCRAHEPQEPSLTLSHDEGEESSAALRRVERESVGWNGALTAHWEQQ